MVLSVEPSSAMASKRPHQRARRTKSTVSEPSVHSHQADVCPVILRILPSGDADQTEHVLFAMPVDSVSLFFFSFHIYLFFCIFELLLMTCTSAHIFSFLFDRLCQAAEASKRTETAVNHNRSQQHQDGRWSTTPWGTTSDHYLPIAATAAKRVFRKHDRRRIPYGPYVAATTTRLRSAGRTPFVTA